MVKNEFDNKYKSKQEITSLIPVHLTNNKTCKIKNENNQPNEEYYKWQLVNILINTGMFSKDYLGSSIHFPKGNKNSKDVILDIAIFATKDWYDYYKKWINEKDYDSLDFLKENLIGIIEIKNENSKDIKTVFNQQLKSYMDISQEDFVFGAIYDTERTYLFKKLNKTYLRFDETLNLKKEKSKTDDLSLDVPDSYNIFPNYAQLIQKNQNINIDRSNRTINDLDMITGVYNQRLNDNIASILKVMDKQSMKNQRGYQILIQMLALKIFDEKRSEEYNQELDFYETEDERKKLCFYINPDEKNFIDLNDTDVQCFIERMKELYNSASAEYDIINKNDDETISWKNESHINVIGEIVYQFQDYSLIKSDNNDLYQIVFYKFANEFSKAEKAQFLTPLDVIDFLVKLINPKKFESIIDPTVGIADFLSLAYINSNGSLKDKNLFGIDNDQDMIMLAKLNMLLNGDGNAILRYKPDKGSLIWKFNKQGELFKLDYNLNKNGKWDERNDNNNLKKFDIVLTNPPFGANRAYNIENTGKETLNLYELWNLVGENSIDPGLIFLENAVRLLETGGRLGIVLSNSIASIEKWRPAREWLINKLRIVAIFDLPSNIFTDTGVNTTLIIAYKPSSNELNNLKNENYEVFVKNIKNVGYKIKTRNRVKQISYDYKLDENYNIRIDDEGKPLINEDFSITLKEFKKWVLKQEKSLQEKFLER